MKKINKCVEELKEAIEDKWTYPNKIKAAEEKAESKIENSRTALAQAILDSGALAGTYDVIDSDYYDSYEIGINIVNDELTDVMIDYLRYNNPVLSLADDVNVKIILADRYSNKPNLRIIPTYPTKIDSFLRSLPKYNIEISLEGLLRTKKYLEIEVAKTQRTIDEWTLRKLEEMDEENDKTENNNG